MTFNTILSEFLAIAGLHIIAVASPGPDFAIILKQSIRYGKTTGFYTAAGIGSGIFLHIVYTLLGFSLLIQEYDWAYTSLKIIGGGFLVFIGYKSVLAKPINLPFGVSESKVSNNFKAFKIGFLVNALNVKATLFFLSVYTAVVSTETPLQWQITYGIWMALATFLWFAFLASILGNYRFRNKITQYSHWIERISGVILILVGLKLLFDF